MRSLRWRGLLCGLVCVLVAGMPVASVAAAPGQAVATAREQAWSLSRELMSPFCPGMTLATCPSPNAATLREEIAGRFARGETRDAITRDLVARFGPGMLGTPAPAGAGLLAWMLPGLLGGGLLIGLVLLWRGRRAGRLPEPTDAGVGPLPPTEGARLASRLDEELERLA